MKTDSARKQNLIQDARRERGGSSGDSPGPSRYGDGFGWEEKRGRVGLNVLFTLSSENNAGFFKTGKIFEVRKIPFRTGEGLLVNNLQVRSRLMNLLWNRLNNAMEICV